MNKRNYIQESIRVQRRYETKYFGLIKKIIQAEIDKVISILKTGGMEAARHHVDGMLTNPKLIYAVRELYIEVGSRFARKTWISLQDQRRSARKAQFVSHEYELKELKGFGFNAQWVKWILDFFKDYLIEKITFAVAETTRNAMLAVLSDSITNGWGIDKTVEAMDQLPLSAMQAARIARTEITRAANAGVFAAGKTFPYEQTKEWMAAHDKRTRGQEKTPHASHVDLDGQVIDYEAKFVDSINGDELLFPGDPNGSAASVINCRCNIALVAKVDQNGRLIPKNKINENVPV